MSLETEVASLTSATTNLLNAVNVSKATLDNSTASAAANAATATTQATSAASGAATANAHKEAAAASATSAAASATSAGTAAVAAANTLISAVTQRPRITPSLSVDWTQKPTAAALTAAGWTISRAGEITSFGLPTKAAENLFVRSQDFGNAAWTKAAATVGAVTDESGLVGSTVVATAVAGYHAIYTIITNTNIGSANYRIRFLVKAGAYTKCVIADPSSTRAGAAFDLGTGATIGTGYGVGYVSHSITPHELGGGLYWCELVMTSAAAGVVWTTSIAGYPDSGATLDGYGAYYTGDGVSGIEVYAAQLQQGFDGDYIPTTTGPITLYEPQLVTTAANELAYQHNESGECIGLVQYPSDTNLILQSQNLATTWAGTSISTSVSKRRWAGVAPFWRIAKNTTGTGASMFQNVAFTALSAATPYTLTAALLADQWSATSSVRLSIYSHTTGTTPSGQIVVISGPGTVVGSNVVSGLSTTTPTLVRYTATLPIGTASIRIQIFPDEFSSTTPGAAILATRVHLSASPRLMPYIPTATAAVTRGAQSITLGGSAFSAVNNPKEGTLLAKVVREDPVNNATKIYARMDVGSVFDGFSITLTTGVNTGNAGGSVVNASGSQAQFELPVPLSVSPVVFANSYVQNAFQFAVNGQLSTVDTLGIVPRVTTLRLSAGGGLNSDPDGYYQRTELYPRAMTSAELAAVTTPGVL